MKRIICSLLLLISLSGFAQSNIGILNRFTDPEKGSTVFIEKGHYALGITGGYHNFEAKADNPGGGFGILSILNIGDGRLAIYNVSPSFSYFIANDLSLGVRLDYSGYTLDSDIRANLNEWLNLEIEDETLAEQLNLHIFGRHMVNNSWGGSLSLRKYLSFFGSKTFAVFGEARLYGDYGHIVSCPLNRKTHEQVTAKTRTSDVWSAGLKFGGGLCIRLKDNSAFTLGIPIVGANYSYTKQHQAASGSDAHMALFNISRDIDFMAIQVGYTHYIKSKKH